MYRSLVDETGSKNLGTSKWFWSLIGYSLHLLETRAQRLKLLLTSWLAELVLFGQFPNIFNSQVNLNRKWNANRTKSPELKGSSWGADIRRGLYTGVFASQNRLRLYFLEGNLLLKIDWATDYSWKEIYVRNLHEFFTETPLEDVDLSKTQPCKLNTQPQITLVKTQYSVQMR